MYMNQYISKFLGDEEEEIMSWWYNSLERAKVEIIWEKETDGRSVIFKTKEIRPYTTNPQQTLFSMVKNWTCSL